MITLVSLCAGAGWSTAPTSDLPPAPDHGEVTTIPPSPISRALARASSDPGSFDSLRLLTRCLGENSEYEQVEIFGDGITIWNNESQLRVPRLAVQVVFHLVLDAGFGEMPDTFGGDRPGDPPQAEPTQSAPLRILCEIEVEADGVRKRVEQLSRGEQSAELKSLATEILRRLGRRGRFGVTAEGVDDGLEKVAAGELDPRTLRLTFSQRSESRSHSDKGLLLRLRGLRGTVQPFEQGAGYGKPVEVVLYPDEFARLGRRLAAIGLEKLPANLYAEDYVDVTIEVLRHRASFQARRFAGLTRESMGADQRAFEALVEAVRDVLPQQPDNDAAGIDSDDAAGDAPPTRR